MRIKLFLLLGILGLLFAACGDEEEPMTEECDTADITYTNTVKAVFDASCATTACHSDNTLAGGFSLSDYEKSKLAAGFGKIGGAINHTDGFAAMPSGASKLDDCVIEKIEAWIAADAPE